MFSFVSVAVVIESLHSNKFLTKADGDYFRLLELSREPWLRPLV